MRLPVGPGDTVGGAYVIERLLGQGGMGAVFVAHEERLGRRVAIKFLLPESADDEAAIARFEREARAAAALQSDHATRVLSVGHHPSGAPYIVMELLHGEDVAAHLGRRGPLPAHEVVQIVVQACDALAEAHALGIVHRDLKPANIFLAQRPNGSTIVKVLDFGISKATTLGSGHALTSTAAIIGTPGYMSPEQLREAKNVDGRADVWALGVTMYEMLTGAPPFNASALAELCALVLTAEPLPLAKVRPDLSPAMTAVVERCLRKNADERFAGATELARALNEAMGVQGSRPGPPLTAATAVAVTPVGTRRADTGDGAPVATGMSTVDPLSRTPWLEPRLPSAARYLAGGALLAVASVGLWAATRPGDDERALTPDASGVNAANAGANGSGANGAGANGSSANGAGANGSSANGSGANGPGTKGAVDPAVAALRGGTGLGSTGPAPSPMARAPLSPGADGGARTANPAIPVGPAQAYPGPPSHANQAPRGAAPSSAGQPALPTLASAAPSPRVPNSGSPSASPPRGVSNDPLPLPVDRR